MTVQLSGEYGEGGGSIVRLALALSTITGKAFEVNNIRKGRQKSGLKAQHLYCIKALQELCSAKAEGVSLGSSYLRYIPNKIKAKTLNIDIGTAGSIALLLQSVLPPCLFADDDIRLKITGGTSGKWAASFDYFNNIFVPMIRDFYEKLEITLIRRGYYPKGQGKLDIKIKPGYKLSDFSSFDDFHSSLKRNIPKMDLTTQGDLIKIEGISHASLSLKNADVAERQAKAAKLKLIGLECPVKIQTEYCDTACAGSGITLWASFSNDVRLGADSLGEPGKRAEIVGKEAANILIKEIESRAAVDKHLADQILLYMAFIPNSRIKVSELTNHCRTNIYVIEEFLGKVFKIDEDNRIISII